MEKIPPTTAPSDLDPSKVEFQTFKTEEDLKNIVGLIEKELSEPYPIYTYRYFV